MSKKSRKYTAARHKPAISRRALHQGLQEADQLLDHDHPREARFILEDLHQHFPREPDVLALLVNACYDLHGMPHYQHYAEQLLAIQPDDLDLLLSLAGAAVNERGQRNQRIAYRRSNPFNPFPESVDSNPFPAPPSTSGATNLPFRAGVMADEKRVVYQLAGGLDAASIVIQTV